MIIKQVYKLFSIYPIKKQSVISFPGTMDCLRASVIVTTMLQEGCCMPSWARLKEAFPMALISHSLETHAFGTLSCHVKCPATLSLPH